MLELRPYQQKAIDDVFSWFDTHTGNPCIEAPTGSGKSLILAGIIQKCISIDPSVRILMLTHQKELIEQDLQKFQNLVPLADIGIYSASIGKKETGHQVTFAGIASIHRHSQDFQNTNIVLIDEAHLINAEQTGMYRTFISELPHAFCIGLTATPYRLKSGMITDGGLFSEPLIKTVSIKWLQAHGYLCKLVSKGNKIHLNTDNVHKVAGDYKKDELEKAVDIPGTNKDVVNAVISLASDRHSWIFFCAGVSHAEHICSLLTESGISAACVTGSTPKQERETILNDFKAGNIQAITNNSVLTTGFDAPNIDLIVMLRPTMSPGLLVQMLGRGLRTSPTKSDCLVLDFTDNLCRLGTIYDIQPPDKHSPKDKGVAPCKQCPNCDFIIPVQSKVCPECGYVFPVQPKTKTYQLSDIDIETNTKRMDVWFWRWNIKETKSGQNCITVNFFDRKYNYVSQWLLLGWQGKAGYKAMQNLKYYANHFNIDITNLSTLEQVREVFNKKKSPLVIQYTKSKYPDFVGYQWEEDLCS